MPEDQFVNTARSPQNPAHSAAEIIPSDTQDLPQVTLALNVATFGRVRVTTVDNEISDVTISPGVAFPLRVARVWQSGTTATGIRGLF